jgi:hypothetical protein
VAEPRLVHRPPPYILRMRMYRLMSPVEFAPTTTAPISTPATTAVAT